MRANAAMQCAETAKEVRKRKPKEAAKPSMAGKPLVLINPVSQYGNHEEEDD